MGKNTEKLTREECLQLTGEADIVRWCAANGVPVTNTGRGRYVHGMIPSLEIRGSRWRRTDNGYGRLGQYAAGDLVSFLMEYEGLSYDDAVQAVLCDQMPGAVFPPRQTSRDSPPAGRLPLAERVHRAGRQNGLLPE